MNYKKIKQIYNKLKKYDVTFVGYGIQTTDGISKGIGLIAGVEKKQVFPEKKIPEKINGETVDVQEIKFSQCNRQDEIVSDSQTLFIDNATKNWKGSAGHVCYYKGKKVMLTNYHVAPDVGDEIFFEGQFLGKTIKTYEKSLYDISAIMLEDQTIPTSGDLGARLKDINHNDIVWHDGGMTGKNQGKVGSIGILGVNDPILGRFQSYGFLYLGINEEKITASGDSGSMVWSSLYGENYAVGVANGENARWATAVPLYDFVKENRLIRWGRVKNISMELYRAKMREKIYNRKYR